VSHVEDKKVNTALTSRQEFSEREEDLEGRYKISPKGLRPEMNVDNNPVYRSSGNKSEFLFIG
jgi:hypothetical protein